MTGIVGFVFKIICDLLWLLMIFFENELTNQFVFNAKYYKNQFFLIVFLNIFNFVGF